MTLRSLHVHVLLEIGALGDRVCSCQIVVLLCLWLPAAASCCCVCSSDRLSTAAGCCCVCSSDRMFAVCYSSIHLLEMVASHCWLSYHSYLCEVGGDGSVLGGMKLEIAILQKRAMPTRVFFCSRVSVGSKSPFEEAALQAVYGFVVCDFNYEGMASCGALAQSAIVLTVSLARSAGPVSRFAVLVV